MDYSGRPNKEYARQRIVRCIEASFNPAKEGSENLCYISLGGYQFLDTELIYRRFKIKNLYSIENDDATYKRAEFNSPYEFIDITDGTIRDFLRNYEDQVRVYNNIIYMDYTGGLGANILEELSLICNSDLFDNDGLLFITFNAGSFSRSSAPQQLLDNLPEDVLSPEMFREWIANDFVDIINHDINVKYSGTKDIAEVIKAFYIDTSQMVVLGYEVVEGSAGGGQIVKIELENWDLTTLTNHEKHYIKRHISLGAQTIASDLGLTEIEVNSFIELL